jgi:1,4-alpha-glucan branching enzyme
MPKAATKKSNKTVIDCAAPAASAVYLAGSFNDWDMQTCAMERQDDGVWRVELELPPGRYEYKFVVDGIWCCDPGSEDSPDREGCVPNVYGSMNRVLDVQEPGA